MWTWSFWPFKRKVRVPNVSYDTLHVVNRLRAQNRLPALDHRTAQAAVASNYESPSFDMFGFLVGYQTGIPLGLTTGSLAGAALHSTHAVADTGQGWYSDSARSRDEEPMVPRYTEENRRRRDEESVTPVYSPYTTSSTPSSDQEIFYKPARESFYDSTPSYSSSDDNRSSYSSSDSYSSGSSYDSSSSSSSDSSSSSSSSE